MVIVGTLKVSKFKYYNFDINEDVLGRSAAASLLNSMVPIAGSMVFSKFQRYILSLFGFIILTTSSNGGHLLNLPHAFSPRQCLMAEINIVHI